MPITTPAINGHSRRMMSRRWGPTKVCQILVTIAGTMTMASACPGGMVTASRPIETVGRPSPSTPLMKPASSSEAAMRSSMESNMKGTLTDRHYRHNLEITETAFGDAEGCLEKKETRHALRSGRSAALHRGSGRTQHHAGCLAGKSGAGVGERAVQGPGTGARHSPAQARPPRGGTDRGRREPARSRPHRDS